MWNMSWKYELNFIVCRGGITTKVSHIWLTWGNAVHLILNSTISLIKNSFFVLIFLLSHSEFNGFHLREISLELSPQWTCPATSPQIIMQINIISSIAIYLEGAGRELILRQLVYNRDSINLWNCWKKHKLSKCGRAWANVHNI